MRPTVFGAVLCGVFFASSCAHAPLVPRAWIGTAQTRQLRYLHLANFVEDTPDGVAHEALVDEARLASFKDGVACVDLIERTALNYDEPLAELTPLCRAAVEQPAAVTDETVTVTDYNFATRQVVERVHAVTLFGFTQMTVEQPTEETFRVLERHAQLCCPTGGKPGVAILVKNPRLRVNDVGAAYGELFQWEVMAQ